VTKVINPELDQTGAVSFDAGKLQQWRHPNQQYGLVTGQMIYDDLLDTEMLKGCLGLRDLWEMRKKGAEFYRRHFANRSVFGWKSTAMNKRDQVAAPYLCIRGNSVLLDWRPLTLLWDKSDLALRHETIVV
jgi:hypothetical protein